MWVNSRADLAAKRHRKKKWGKVGGMWVNSNANLAAKRHRKKKKRSQQGRDLKEFLWQMHPDQLSDRDRSRFVRREARRRHGQHGALNYKDRREARRVARRRGQDGISALADADAALADVALAEAGAASATMQHDPLATLLSSPPFRKLACAESALTAAAAAATADMIASDDADSALADAALAEAGAATATAAAQATTAALRAVREEHAMNELIEKEGSSWRVDPGAAPGPALSPAPAPATAAVQATTAALRAVRESSVVAAAATPVLVAKLVGRWDPADGHPWLPDEALVVVATVSELRAWRRLLQAFRDWDSDL